MACSGADHSLMKENVSCNNGKSLYASIISELGVTSSAPPPLLAVSPDFSWNYGNLSVNSSSSKDFMLSNNGGSSLTVNSLGVTGAADFAITSAPSTPFTIPASSSQTVTVRFRPTSTIGETASLAINSNASNAPSKVIALAGTGISVTSCTYSLSASTQSFSPASGGGSFTVTAGSGCAWAATSNVPWLIIISPSGGNGTGTQSLSFTIGANAGSLRVGTINVVGGGQTQTFLVTQDASSSGSCVYSLSPNYQSLGSSSVTGSVSLTTTSTCGWSASSATPWLNVNTTGTHLGSGTLSFTVAANSSTQQRTGTISVTGQGSNTILSVVQAGAASSCSYSLSPSQATVVYQGGFTYFSVASEAGCNWRASASDTWITIQTGSYGNGSGQVQFNVGQNPATSPRTSFITVQGDTQTLGYTLTQQGQPNVFPSISLPTTSYKVGNALVAATAYQTVTVQNNGNGPLYVGSIYLLSGTSEFSAPATIPSIPLFWNSVLHDIAHPDVNGFLQERNVSHHE